MLNVNKIAVEYKQTRIKHMLTMNDTGIAKLFHQ